MEGNGNGNALKQTVGWVLVVVLIGAVVMTAVYMRERQGMANEIDRLNDTDPAVRSEASAYLFGGDSREFGRLGQSLRASDLLETESRDFSDASLEQVFENLILPANPDWAIYVRTPRTFIRAVIAGVRSDPLATERRGRAVSMYDKMLQYGGGRKTPRSMYWRYASTDDRDLILAGLLEISIAAASDPNADFESTGIQVGLERIGDEALVALDPLVNSVSPELRRKTWFMLAASGDLRGHDPDWDSADPAVAEAMIVAKVAAALNADEAIDRLRNELNPDSAYHAVLDTLAVLPRDTRDRLDLSPDRMPPPPPVDLIMDIYQASTTVWIARRRLLMNQQSEDFLRSL